MSTEGGDKFQEGVMTKSAFTLIEILIVITILGILAVAIIPNFIGMDREARVAATRSNLDAIRTTIRMFRAKEGRYPAKFEELIEKTFYDAGIKKHYLDKVPKEMMSDKSGNDTYEDQESTYPLTGDGGWTYFVDKADVVVDWIEKLDESWGEGCAGDIPSEW